MNLAFTYRYETAIPCLCAPLGDPAVICLPSGGDGGCPTIVPTNPSCPVSDSPAPCSGGCFDRAVGLAGPWNEDGYLPENNGNCLLIVPK